jgi:sulfur-carrier protein
MIAVNIAGFLTDFTDGRNRVELDSTPGTVRDALNQLWLKHVGLRDRVVNEKGEIRQHVNVFVNNQTIRRQEVLDTALADGGELTIMPSVSGGANAVNREP